MIQAFRYASADTEMRDACYKDLRRFYLDGEWWEGSYGKQFTNKPKPEFNKLFRSINRITGDINDMELNAVIISNSDEATDEGAELLQKRWRNDFQSSDGIEASEIATMEATVGGFGCTKSVSKYEDEENPSPDSQYLCNEIIHSACTSVFFDAGAIRKDKSDATKAWQLIRTNKLAIEEEYGVDVVSFMNPAFDGEFDRLNYNSERDIYLAHYWEVINKNLTTYDFSMMMPLKITTGDGIKDEFGETYTRDELKELRDIYSERIGEDVPTVKRKVKSVMYALCDGEKFLTKPSKTPFKRIPLYPRYGYYAVLNGEEYYCGEVRKKTDAEMFHNMFGATMMEIMAQPQVGKPEYTPEQIARHSAQRASADIDNAAYLMSDPITNADGSIAHLGPIAVHQPPQIGTGLASAGQFLSGTIAEENGTGQATVPANASGEAIQQVNERQDDTYLPIVKNVLHAIKAQCEGWIPAAQKLYFTNQRRLRVIEKDGKTSQVTTLDMIQKPTGEYGPYGNTAPGRYSVTVEKGEAYKSQRQAERESNMEMLNFVGSDTEMGQLIAMHSMTLTSGEGGDTMRNIARYRMLDIMMGMGYPFEPENEEEAAYVQQKQQQMMQAQQNAAQNDPEMLQAQAAQQLAQAETIKGQAQVMDKQIKQYTAETGRMSVLVDAKKAGADIDAKKVDLQIKAMGTLGKNIAS